MKTERDSISGVYVAEYIDRYGTRYEGLGLSAYQAIWVCLRRAFLEEDFYKSV